MGIYGTRDGKFHVKKLTVEDKVSVSFTIPYAIAVSTTYILSGWDVSAGVQKTNTGFANQPPYPVELSVDTKVAGTAGGGDNLIFVGYDAKGNSIREVVHVAGTAATQTYTSNAFAKITSITPDDALHKSTDINIGFRNVVGLPYPIDSASDILTAQVGLSYATTALTVDATYDSVDLSALSAGSTANLVWLSKVQ